MVVKFAQDGFEVRLGQMLKGDMAAYGISQAIILLIVKIIKTPDFIMVDRI